MIEIDCKLATSSIIFHCHNVWRTKYLRNLKILLFYFVTCSHQWVNINVLGMNMIQHDTLQIITVINTWSHRTIICSWNIGIIIHIINMESYIQLQTKIDETLNTAWDMSGAHDIDTCNYKVYSVINYYHYIIIFNCNS